MKSLMACSSILFMIFHSGGCALADSTRLVPVADGWAQTSINAVIFRRNSICTHGDLQYVAFYDPNGNVVLARRTLGTKTWEIRTTPYKGDVRDAHNSISIMVDGDGYLHMAWNHHGNPLNYCRSIEPNSLELTEKVPMTGLKENRVTYPEFYKLPDGDLVFFYRDGASGQGDMTMDLYDTKTQTWTQQQNTLIDGEGRRNAYWQACVDEQGTIHVSWVWRETGDVATNHDLCYAKSLDKGVTWVKSNGEPYELPIRLGNAEYAWRIAQGSDLINQTSMCADSLGRPYIATYWGTGSMPTRRNQTSSTSIPQFHVVYFDGEQWKDQQVTDRQMPFSLNGGGTKRIPISRPQIVADANDGVDKAYLIFRDEERGSVVSIAACNDLSLGEWSIHDVTDFSVGQWEPTYDTELWRTAKQLHLFVQNVGQGDAETTEDIPPQMVSVLEWIPNHNQTVDANTVDD